MTAAATPGSVFVLRLSDDAGDRVHVFATAGAAWLTWTRIPRVAEFLAEHYPGVSESDELEEACRLFNDASDESAIVEETTVETSAYEDGTLV